MKPRTDDQLLIKQCLDGKDIGYSQLYQKYATSIFHSILRLVSDRAEAEDILQEVFVSVFSNREQLKKLENFEAWTRRIAINTSISRIRKKKIHFSDIELINEIEINDQHEDLEWQEDKIAEIYAAIAQLPASARTIVNLYVFEDLSQEEIGKMLGMTHTAVRSQYHRAKNRIAQMIKGGVYYGG